MREGRRRKREERNGFGDRRRLSSNSLSWRPPVAEPQRWSSSTSALLSLFLCSFQIQNPKIETTMMMMMLDKVVQCFALCS